MDVFIVHTDSEWQLAQKIARLLDERGYSVAHSGARSQAGRDAVESLPSNAAAVLVIWPVARAIFDMPEFEARLAARDGRLVQIYAGAERPTEVYAGPAAVDFVGWDLTATGPKWHALMQRLRRLCGPPTKRPRDAGAALEATVLYSTLVIAAGSIAAVFFQVGHNDALQASAPAPAPVGAVTQEALRIPIVAPPRAARDDDDAQATAGAGLGGPEDYDTDLGVEVTEVTPPPPPAAPAPVKRAPQNPPSALE